MIGIMHILIELIVTFKDMAVFKVSLKNYLITLLTGRMNAVPYIHHFVSDESEMTLNELDYNKMSATFFNIIFK